MKITIKEVERTYKDVEVEVKRQTMIPVWTISKSHCDLCGFHFNETSNSLDLPIVAIQLENGALLHVHQECYKP